MQQVFLDSSAIYAIVDRNDAAGPIVERYLRAEQPLLLTTHLIFAEANSLITKRLGKSVGERTGDLLQRSDFVQLVFLDEVVHREAWNLYKKYRDKDFDYIDATSFVFCKRRGIREVLTFDRHFAQMGFRIVP